MYRNHFNHYLRVGVKASFKEVGSLVHQRAVELSACVHMEVSKVDDGLVFMNRHGTSLFSLHNYWEKLSFIFINPKSKAYH